MTAIAIPDDMLYGPTTGVVKKPHDFRRRGPDGPPIVQSPTLTRKRKGLKADLYAAAQAAGLDVPANPKDITVEALHDLLGPEARDETYQRPSSIGDVLENEFNLIRWKERNLVRGLWVLGVECVDEPPTDDAWIDGLVARAYAAADTGIHADRGTHLHLLCELFDRGQAYADVLGAGEDLGIPMVLQLRAAQQWLAFRHRRGIRALAIEATCVNDDLKAAGSLDRIDVCDHDIVTPFGTIPAGHAYVGDIKTGTPRAKYAAQLAAYAGSVPYDTDTDERGEWPQPIHRGIGLIYRYDIRAAIDGELVDWEIIPVDLAHGLEGARLSLGCREWGKTSALADPITIKEAPCDTTLTTTSTPPPSISSTSTTTPAPTPPAASTISTSSPTPSSDETSTWPSSRTPTTLASTGEPGMTLPPTSPSPSISTAASSASPDRQVIRARLAELIEAGHEAVIRQHWPAGVPTLKHDAHTAEQLADLWALVLHVRGLVSWPFDEHDQTINPEGMPPASPAATDESPPRPAPQLPDEGGDVDPGDLDALTRAFQALPEPARTAISVISREANAAGRSISVSTFPTLRRWCIARALVKWGEWYRRPDGFLARIDLLWIEVGNLLDSSQVTPADDTLGALIGALTIDQANRLADAFDITVAA